MKKDVKTGLGLPLVSVREDMEGEVSVDVVYTGDYPISMIQMLPAAGQPGFMSLS